MFWFEKVVFRTYTVVIPCLIYEYCNMVIGDEPDNKYCCTDLGCGLSKHFIFGCHLSIRRKEGWKRSLHIHELHRFLKVTL